MEDRYLFKAKRIDNGEWEIGSLIALPTGEYEISNKCNNPPDCDPMWDKVVITHKVEPPTICQCTGLKDKNGNMIWENDIVRFKHEKFDFDDGLESFERTCLPNKKEYKRNYVVEFCNTPTHYGLRFRNGSIWFMVHKMTIVMHDTEVIGNIFDNAELLESEE